MFSHLHVSADKVIHTCIYVCINVIVDYENQFRNVQQMCSKLQSIVLYLRLYSCKFPLVG